MRPVQFLARRLPASVTLSWLVGASVAQTLALENAFLWKTLGGN